MDCPTNNINIPTPLVEPCGGYYISTSCVSTPNSLTYLDLPAGSSQTQVNESLVTALNQKEQQIQSISTDLYALDGSETKVISGTNITVTGTGTAIYPYVVNSIMPYKTYTALLSQSGTAAPSAIILSNEAGISVIYARTSAGKNTATITGFVPNKTAVIIGSGYLETVVTASFQSSTLIQIRNFVLEAGVNTYYDDELNQVFFEIRIYN